MTREDGIKTVMGGGGHVVILGAGASIVSTLRNPEKNGKKLPNMNNLIDIVGLTDIMSKLPHSVISENFEQLYSNLHLADPHSNEIREIQSRIYTYFKDMELPDEPTIYDYLILSLRSKDLIATFNWDPFLFQAFNRNRHVGNLPYICFLHGNTAIGYSIDDKLSGPAGWYSNKTSSYFEPTKLLYPIADKDYINDEFISTQWLYVKEALQSDITKRVTIFGYGAPASDLAAIKLLNDAWGTPQSRDTEEFEVIDIRDPDELIQQWSGFIHKTHYNVAKSFFDSVIAHQPRRTSESFFHHYFPTSEEEAWAEPNPVPQNFKTLQEMWDWYKPLIQAEEEWDLKRANK